MAEPGWEGEPWPGWWARREHRANFGHKEGSRTLKTAGHVAPGLPGKMETEGDTIELWLIEQAECRRMGVVCLR